MIMDGHSRTGLDIIRDFGSRGIPVYAGEDSKTRVGSSKYVTHRFKYSKENGLEATNQTILAKIRELKPDVFLPLMDDSWEMLYFDFQAYTRLTKVVPCPGQFLFRHLLEKNSLMKRAEQYQVPIPKTFQPQSLEEALGMADRLPYPVLLKPIQSVGGAGIQKARNAGELERMLTGMPDLPIVQEYLEGEDLELTLLFVNGKPLAGSVYKSIRNYPLPYGPPCAVRTIRDDELMNLGIEFLKNLDYHGVAHLDFRRDRKDGIPKLLDFNARLAGTNEISTRSGVSFPYMLYRLALNEPVKECFDYQLGLEFRWTLMNELGHLWQTPHKLQTVKELLHRKNVHSNISLADPIPHFYQLLTLGAVLGEKIGSLKKTRV